MSHLLAPSLMAPQYSIALLSIQVFTLIKPPQLPIKNEICNKGDKIRTWESFAMQKSGTGGKQTNYDKIYDRSKYWKFERQKNWVRTWIMPLTRHAPFLQKTIFGSSGCRDLSSSLTSSLLALWSLVNCSAMTLFDLLKQPIIARESPALAIYNVLPQITPTKQHDPLAEISGFEWRIWRTWPRNSSSVAKNAFFKTSSDIDSLSCTIPVRWGEIN